MSEHSCCFKLNIINPVDLLQIPSITSKRTAWLETAAVFTHVSKYRLLHLQQVLAHLIRVLRDFKEAASSSFEDQKSGLFRDGRSAGSSKSIARLVNFLIS